jgi:hypothetical protein
VRAQARIQDSKSKIITKTSKEARSEQRFSKDRSIDVKFDAAKYGIIVW